MLTSRTTTTTNRMMAARPLLSVRVVTALVPSMARRPGLSFRPAGRSFASTALFEANQNLVKQEEQVFANASLTPSTTTTGSGVVMSSQNSLSISNQQPKRLFLLASATSNRLGTGVGVALVVVDSSPVSSGTTNNSDNEAKNDNNDTTTITTSFGVYFEQHRSLYEREYTAVIVALRWLQTHQEVFTGAVPANVPRPIIVLPIREDIVFNQLMKNYPVEKESLRTLNRIAAELIQDLNIKLELCPKAAPFQQCKDLSSRALLLERSDTGFAALVDPLDPYSLPTSEEFMEREDIAVLEEFYGGGIIPVLKSLDDIDASLESENDRDGPYGRTTERRADDLVPERTSTSLNIDPNRTYLLQFDGGARGNPHGPSGCGMVIYDEGYNKIWSGRKYLGERMTNNQAEYTGIVLGLQTANAMGIRRLRCQGDSELIIKQLKGQYKVKNEGLKPFHLAANEAIKGFEFFEAEHIFRKDNAVADALANQAMDYKSSFGL